MSRSVRDPDYRQPEKPTKPVPLEYCDSGVCWKLADRWEYAHRYGEWLAVCDEHGDRIKAAGRLTN